jgi:AcrR family transcriptional regulator
MTDHRTRVAKERRDRTRATIIEAAIRVFAEKGPDAPVIDDFIRAAGVARGTFYNYYQSTAELLEATARWLEDDLVQSIDGEILPLPSPIDRVTTGVRLWMWKAEVDPAWCAFTVRVRRHGPLVEEKLMRDLRAGLKDGSFNAPSPEIARDLVVGTVQEAMGRIPDGRLRPGQGDDVARVILRGLGLTPRAIDKALARPVPEMRRPAKALGTTRRLK